MWNWNRRHSAKGRHTGTLSNSTKVSVGCIFVGVLLTPLQVFVFNYRMQNLSLALLLLDTLHLLFMEHSTASHFRNILVKSISYFCLFLTAAIIVANHISDESYLLHILKFLTVSRALTLILKVYPIHNDISLYVFVPSSVTIIISWLSSIWFYVGLLQLCRKKVFAEFLLSSCTSNNALSLNWISSDVILFPDRETVHITWEKLIQILWRSIYFVSISIFTVGYGDIHPTSDQEYILCCVILVCAIVSFNSIVSSLILIIKRENYCTLMNGAEISKLKNLVRKFPEEVKSFVIVSKLSSIVESCGVPTNELCSKVPHAIQLHLVDSVDSLNLMKENGNIVNENTETADNNSYQVKQKFWFLLRGFVLFACINFCLSCFILSIFLPFHCLSHFVNSATVFSSVFDFTFWIFILINALSAWVLLGVQVSIALQKFKTIPSSVFQQNKDDQSESSIESHNNIIKLGCLDIIRSINWREILLFGLLAIPFEWIFKGKLESSNAFFQLLRLLGVLKIGTVIHETLSEIKGLFPVNDCLLILENVANIFCYIVYASLFVSSTSSIWLAMHFTHHSTKIAAVNTYNSVYWCLVTITTTGYGDLVPETMDQTYIAIVTVAIGTVVFAAVLSYIVNFGFSDIQISAYSASMEYQCVERFQKFIRGFNGHGQKLKGNDNVIETERSPEFCDEDFGKYLHAGMADMECISELMKFENTEQNWLYFEITKEYLRRSRYFRSASLQFLNAVSSMLEQRRYFDGDDVLSHKLYTRIHGLFIVFDGEVTVMDISCPLSKKERNVSNRVRRNSKSPQRRLFAGDCFLGPRLIYSELPINQRALCAGDTTLWFISYMKLSVAGKRSNVDFQQIRLRTVLNDACSNDTSPELFLNDEHDPTINSFDAVQNSPDYSSSNIECPDDEGGIALQHPGCDLYGNFSALYDLIGWIGGSFLDACVNSAYLLVLNQEIVSKYILFAYGFYLPFVCSFCCGGVNIGYILTSVVLDIILGFPILRRLISMKRLKRIISCLTARNHPTVEGLQFAKGKHVSISWIQLVVLCGGLLPLNYLYLVICTVNSGRNFYTGLQTSVQLFSLLSFTRFLLCFYYFGDVKKKISGGNNAIFSLLRDIFGKIEAYLNESKGFRVVQSIVYSIFAICFCMNLSGCLFFAIARIEAASNQSNWVAFYLNDEIWQSKFCSSNLYLRSNQSINFPVRSYNESLVHNSSSSSIILNQSHNMYLLSIYWAVQSLVTVGYGDIVPVSSYEKWFTIVLFCGGAILFAAVLARLQNSVQQDGYFHEYRQKCAVINSILMRESVDDRNDDIDRMMDTHRQWMFNVSFGIPLNHVKKMMGENSCWMETVVYSKIQESITRQSSLFGIFHSSILKEICGKMELELFVKGDILLFTNQLVSELFFVSNGTVVLNNSQKSILYDGEHRKARKNSHSNLASNSPFSKSAVKVFPMKSNVDGHDGENGKLLHKRVLRDHEKKEYMRIKDGFIFEGDFFLKDLCMCTATAAENVIALKLTYQALRSVLSVNGKDDFLSEFVMESRPFLEQHTSKSLVLGFQKNLANTKIVKAFHRSFVNRNKKGGFWGRGSIFISDLLLLFFLIIGVFSSLLQLLLLPLLLSFPCSICMAQWCVGNDAVCLINATITFFTSIGHHFDDDFRTGLWAEYLPVIGNLKVKICSKKGLQTVVPFIFQILSFSLSIYYLSLLISSNQETINTEAGEVSFSSAEMLHNFHRCSSSTTIYFLSLFRWLTVYQVFSIVPQVKLLMKQMRVFTSDAFEPGHRNSKELAVWTSSTTSSDLQPSTSDSFSDMVTCFLVLIFTAHTFSCILLFISCLANGSAVCTDQDILADNDSISFKSINPQDLLATFFESSGLLFLLSCQSPSKAYIRALYWGFYTISSVGYGTVRMDGTVSKLTATISILLGCILSSYIAAVISSQIDFEINKFNAIRRIEAGTLKLKSHLTAKLGMHEPLGVYKTTQLSQSCGRVESYFRFLEQEYGGFHFNDVWEHFPSFLRRSLIIKYSIGLRQLFDSTMHRDSISSDNFSGFVASLVYLIKPYIAIEGERFTNEEISKLWILRCGEVGVFSKLSFCEDIANDQTTETDGSDKITVNSTDVQVGQLLWLEPIGGLFSTSLILSEILFESLKEINLHMDSETCHFAIQENLGLENKSTFTGQLVPSECGITTSEDDVNSFDKEPSVWIIRILFPNNQIASFYYNSDEEYSRCLSTTNDVLNSEKTEQGTLSTREMLQNCGFVRCDVQNMLIESNFAHVTTNRDFLHIEVCEACSSSGSAENGEKKYRSRKLFSVPISSLEHSHDDACIGTNASNSFEVKALSLSELFFIDDESLVFNLLNKYLSKV